MTAMSHCPTLTRVSPAFSAYPVQGSIMWLSCLSVTMNLTSHMIASAVRVQELLKSHSSV